MLRIRRKFAFILCGVCLSAFLFFYFLINHSLSTEKSQNLQTIESKIQQLEHGLDVHRIEVGEIRKQIHSIQEKSNSKQINGDQPENQMLVAGRNEMEDVVVESKCDFRTDIDPRTDIQMLDVYNSLPFENADGGVWKQGWNIEYDPHEWNSHHKLKVFVVPHSHNDPGWVKTFDEYYEQLTKSILTNMLHQLSDNLDMTFIWAEISYFSKWYEQLSSAQKSAVKSLVKRGQLEFVTGGWVMTDEANSHWLSMLQQLTEGQKWLKVHFNSTPRSSWSIDPFGYSSVMPLILKGAGFENLLIQRTHYEVKKRLARNKELEFRWRQPWDLNGETDLLTHMMPFYSYDVPHTCGPDPKVCCQFDFKRLPGYGLTCPWHIPPRPIDEINVAKKAELILDQWRKKSTLYKTRTVLIPLGDDFRFSQNTEWEAQHTNFVKLFDYINNEPSLNAEAKFGTLQEYFDAVREEKGLSDFPSLSGDFFTYADRDDHYWSGYFTSRPFHKRLDRILMTYLRSAEMLHAWSIWDSEANFDILLESARRALSLFQHHDGITGTERDHVVKDYARQMIDALTACKFVIQQAAYRHLTKPSIYQADYTFTYFNIDDSRSHGLNDNRPTIILGDDVPTKFVVIHNSLPKHREEIVEFLVSKPFVMVEDLEGKPLPSQVAPIWSWHRGSFNGISPQASNTKYRLLFKATVPSLGLSTYIIRSTNSMEQSKSTSFSKITIFTQIPFSVNLPDYPNQVEFADPREISLSLSDNAGISASFSSLGLLKSMSTSASDHVPIHLEFLKYGARRGAERSGAYLFIPDGIATPFKRAVTSTVLLTKGPLESSVAAGFPFAIHESILRANENAMEIRNLVDISDTSNTEVVMRMSTGISSKDIFYTDSNGFQFMKRQRFDKLPIQANYYPIPTGVYIEDEKLRLTLLTAQPLGGSSLKSGEIEIMQDRRLDQDDNRGLGQGVQDNEPVLNIFKLTLENVESCEKRSNNYRAGYLTETAHTELNRLLHPAEKLVWHENEWAGVLPNFGSERVPLGVGTEIAVVRSLRLPGTTPNKNPSIGFVANRSYLEQCSQSENDIDETLNIQQVLGLSNDYKAYESKLTLLEKKSQLNSWNINMCPMEIKAFIIGR